MRARVLAVLLGSSALVLTPLALACGPGGGGGARTDTIGSFEVHGALVENGCAPGLSPIDPLAFVVDLTRDERTLTWRVAGGGRPVAGPLASDGDFHLRTTTQVPAWPADPASGVVGCTLTQIETIDGTLRMPPEAADAAAGANDAAASGDAGAGDAGAGDAGAGDAGAFDEPSFEATSRIELVPAAGSDCSALLLVAGGSFPSLPCAARYELEGVTRP